MAIPTARVIEIPLLHLIHTLGGEVSPSDIYEPLADYFKLSEKERNQLLPNGLTKKWDNRVQWTRLVLVHKGFLDGSVRGIWKITPAGRKELARLGLLDKPFPSQFIPIEKSKTQMRREGEDSLSTEDEELIQRVLEEVLPSGCKNFPEDFLSTDYILDEITVPGTELHINPHSKTLVTSPKGYFCYRAKNPPVAKYIVYANKLGEKKIKIPKDNLSIFKAVTSYEKYVSTTIKRCFELFLDFTYDESKAEQLTQVVKERLGLKEKI